MGFEPLQQDSTHMLSNVILDNSFVARKRIRLNRDAGNIIEPLLHELGNCEAARLGERPVRFSVLQFA